MPSGPVALFVPVMIPMTDQAGNVREEWRQFFQLATTQLLANAVALNGVPGVNVKTLATQPSLGAGDAGYLMWLSDYKHLLRWTGATWEFFGGNGNDYVQDCPHAPQTGLWQLCDGSTVNYLTLGATLTETAFTTPNLTGTPAYRKAAAAYTGVINAKGGATAGGVTGTDNTGPAGAHTPHIAAGTNLGSIVNAGGLTPPITVGVNTAWEVLAVAGGVDLNAVADHQHTVPALTVPSLNVGTIEMANIGFLPFYRR